MCDTVFFPEDYSKGIWRLQTTDMDLIYKLNERSNHPNSPWRVVGRGLRVTDPMIYARSFSSITKAKDSLARILKYKPHDSYVIAPLTNGKGFAVKPNPSTNIIKMCFHTKGKTEAEELKYAS